MNLISHATQTRLRTVLEKVSTIAQHRMETCKVSASLAHTYKQHSNEPLMQGSQSETWRATVFQHFILIGYKVGTWSMNWNILDKSRYKSVTVGKETTPCPPPGLEFVPIGLKWLFLMRTKGAPGFLFHPKIRQQFNPKKSGEVTGQLTASFDQLGPNGSVKARTSTHFRTKVQTPAEMSDLQWHQQPCA